jgi:prepilin-type N-terminal cleavage/methylation domain-containing protein
MTIASARRRGFTLIEMVLVLIILATIAGLVISQISALGRTADMAATAKNQQDIANQLSLYFVLQKRMPQRMDSLLQTGATPVVMPALDGAGAPTTDSNTQRWGFPLGGSQGTNVFDQLVATNLRGTTPPAGARRSFTRLGFDFVMDHQAFAAGANCSNSGNVQRLLDGGSAAGCWVARIMTTTNGDTLPSGTGVVPLVLQIYPTLGGALPTGVTAVVAVGVGPSSSLIPDTMLNAPNYPGCDGSYYGRYIAYFACFASEERAQLVGVSDSYGRFPNYSGQQFVESLPNNGRQG